MEQIRIGVKWLAAMAVAGWLQIPYTVQMLLLFMLADILTGLIAAYLRKELHSGASFRGMAKKTLVLILVGVCYALKKPFGLPFDVGEAAAFGFMVNEVISITENCARSGVPLPPQLVMALAKIKPSVAAKIQEEMKKQEEEEAQPLAK